MTRVDTIQIDDFPWVLAPGEFGYWRLIWSKKRRLFFALPSSLLLPFSDLFSWWLLFSPPSLLLFGDKKTSLQKFVMKNISFLMSAAILSQLSNGYLFWRSNALLTADSFLLGFQACISCHVVFLDLLEKERKKRGLWPVPCIQLNKFYVRTA